MAELLIHIKEKGVKKKVKGEIVGASYTKHKSFVAGCKQPCSVMLQTDGGPNPANMLQIHGTPADLNYV